MKGDCPSWPLVETECKSYQLGIRQVFIHTGQNTHNAVSFKEDVEDGKNVRKSFKKINMNEVKAHLFKIDYN